MRISRGSPSPASGYSVLERENLGQQLGDLSSRPPGAVVPRARNAKMGQRRAKASNFASLAPNPAELGREVCRTRNRVAL